jgi:hypothetical protein
VFFVISGFRTTTPRLEGFKYKDVPGGTPGDAFLG